MLNIKTKHVERIKPQMSVDSTGKITWVPGLTDYDASLFYRGKTVTNTEFNDLFLQGTYQGNYITDSLSELFNTHLSTVINRTFKNTFNLKNSYVKTFATSDWGTKQTDGYYYITIPASTHGFEPSQGTDVEKMNIDTEMYVLDEDTGTFFEVTQVETDPDNTVKIYTDDNTITGFLVIRSNDKAYAFAEVEIDASQVKGLATVATTAKYSDLIGRPDNTITETAQTLASLISNTAAKDNHPFVYNADYATNATNATNLLSSGTIQNQPISAIFETGSSTVKKATTAINYADTGNIANKFSELETALDTHITALKNGTFVVAKTTDAVNAVNATNVVSTASDEKYPITINANNQLVVNNEFITRRKLVWEGSLTGNTEEGNAIPLPFSIAKGDLYEVHMSVPIDGYSDGVKCYVHIGDTIVSGTGNIGGVLFTQLSENVPAFWLFSAQITITDHTVSEIRVYPAHATLVNATTIKPINTVTTNTLLYTTVKRIYKIIE